MIYAGIGARATPVNILGKMLTIGHMLGQAGHVLRSGRARGADQAFETGAVAADGAFEYYIAQNATRQKDWFRFAEFYHPNWSACSPIAKALHARNSPIVLGMNLDTPADFVVCWTPGGQVTGGTGQALRIAAAYNIPVFNLAIDGDEARMWSKVYGS